MTIALAGAQPAFAPAGYAWALGASPPRPQAAARSTRSAIPRRAMSNARRSPLSR